MKNKIFTVIKINFLLALLLIAKNATAQQNQYLDSLLQLLPHAKEDTNKVLLLVSIGNETEAKDLEGAKWYYVQAKQLSEKLNYTMGIIKYYTNYSAVLNMQSKFDSGLQLNLQSIPIAKTTGNKERIASCLNNAGASYHYLEDYENAINYYLQSAALLEEMQRYDRLDIIYSNIATTFMEGKLYNKSYIYNQKAVAAAGKLHDEQRQAVALANFGGLLSLIKKYDSATLVLQQAMQVMKKNTGDFEYRNLLLNLANVYMQTRDFKKLGQFAGEAKEISENAGDSLSLVTALFGIATSRFFEKDFTGAEAVCNEGLSISLRNNYKEKKQNFYELLSELAIATGHLTEYFKYNQLSQEAADEEMNSALQKNIQLLDKKFETEKKNNEIVQLNKDRKIKSLWNYILAGSIAAIVLIIVLSYRSYRHKQELQQRRITKLENEKHLLAAEAVLKGQEEERSRLAKDLHDGLGGMLSGIKYSFSNIKDNLIMTPDNQQGFERGLDMLDSSISELRRVAHSMMPEALTKYGLNAALKDFCTGINSSGVIKVVYQSYGLEDLKTDQSISITIYRIIQELLNNTIKHAAASKAVVQVNKEDHKLLVTVEDDGKGFDTALLAAAKGIGWSNIQKRLDYLKATVDIQSSAGKGTSVNIEIEI